MSEDLISLIGDRDDDREMAVLAFKQVSVEIGLTAMADGKRALDYLFSGERFTGNNGSCMPKLVMLDLKTPRIDGMEVLCRNGLGE